MFLLCLEVPDHACAVLQRSTLCCVPSQLSCNEYSSMKKSVQRLHKSFKSMRHSGIRP